MKKNEFIKYDAPQVELIEVEVEKGFAGSTGGSGGEGVTGGIGTN